MCPGKVDLLDPAPSKPTTMQALMYVSAPPQSILVARSHWQMMERVGESNPHIPRLGGGSLVCIMLDDQASLKYIHSHK